MPRKWILAAIGGGEAAGPEVEAFGRLVAQAGAILMTGGKPKPDTKRVTERAQAGCEAAGGLMISVLPDQRQNAIVKCPGERRFEVQTDKNRYVRDPITGAAADMIFVFPGESGTLVELAYASREKRPIVFCGTEAQWRNMKSVIDHKVEGPKLRDGIKKALKEYGPDSRLTPDQITEGEKELMQALKEILNLNNLPTIAHFLQCFLQIHRTPAAQTNFRGLPDCSGIQKFEDLVAQLSAFSPEQRFR
jgi:uncharacterized protein (TIGR00725 family)